MSRNRSIVTIIVVVVIIAAIAFGYIWFSGGSGAPSATLSAPTLAIATRQPTTAPTQAPTVAATAESASTAEATVASTAEATAEATAAATVAAATFESNPVVFNITTEGSKVSFTLGEILNGSANQVVGTTDQIAGQIAVDFANPANSQIGEIRIDARTLATDSGMRDRMIRGQILQSAQDAYEFVSFKPTALTGLPSSVTMGTAFDFKVTGDLTIREITKPVTFDVTVTPTSTSEITGTATTSVQRDDFGLTIPNVPSVTQADEEVKLQIDFTAQSAESAALAVSAATAEATLAPTAQASAATAEATTATSASTSSQLTVFNIATDQSQVSFTLNEVLRGSKNEVVGKTDQVAGQIGVDFGNPANSQIGEIRIDARSLATDDQMRDRTTRGQILQSAQDKYEFISFKPTAITGLPVSVTTGTAFTFQVTGDLTIRDITKPVTFDVTVTPDSQTQISGKATATVLRSDFGLIIPSLPMIADVDDAVKVDIAFGATAAS
ncbi:MAG: YceI family protein [Chloroflexota bacterium]